MALNKGIFGAIYSPQARRCLESRVDPRTVSLEHGMGSFQAKMWGKTLAGWRSENDEKGATSRVSSSWKCSYPGQLEADFTRRTLESAISAFV